MAKDLNRSRWWRKTFLNGWVLTSPMGAAREMDLGLPVRLGSIADVKGSSVMKKTRRTSRRKPVA